MKNLCIVPARGGSKGIPGKNIMLVAGKPLIVWTIESAITSELVDRVIVSTDNDEISEICKANGAEVIKRPDEIAGDFASSESALLHCLEHLEKNESYYPDLVVFLQATSPVRDSRDIDSAILQLVNNNYDCLFSAYAEHFTGRWKLDERLCASPLNFEPNNRPRRQDVDKEFIENGSIYLFKPEILKHYQSRMGGRTGIYEMPLERSFQIDSYEDVSLIEKLLLSMNTHTQPAQLELQSKMPPDTVIEGIKLLAMDFDGVLTDNRVWINENGDESVCCSREDSWGLTLLRRSGVKLAVVSTERNPVVQARCRKLQIQCANGVRDKAEALQNLANQWSIDRSQIAFVGNDLNDKDALDWAGISILIGSKNRSLINLSDWYIPESGGDGALRQICDKVLDVRNKTDRKNSGEGT